jgi:hypothetical protein
MVRRVDLSISQDVFRNVKGKRNSGQFRIDFTNFGNLLNHSWGVSERFTVPVTQANGAQILTSQGADAQGRVSYRMQVVNGALVTKSFQTGTAIADVYQFLLSFRYTFN